MGRLIVSIVVYRSPLSTLEKVLSCLKQAGDLAQAEELIRAVQVVLVDNASGAAYGKLLKELVHRRQAAGLELHLVWRPGNGGYGLGHNEVGTDAGDFRLVLNPDVFLEPDSLVEGLGFLHRHPEVGLVVPWVLDGQGRPDFLCKRYPSVLVLGLRGFAPLWLRGWFKTHLESYEMRDLDWDRPQLKLELVSGCCLLMRGRLWRETGGFCPDYFLYFEDFDFSLRAREKTQIAYVPDFRVTHLGGRAAAKGPKHIVWFARSAIRFFNRYGWRWI